MKISRTRMPAIAALLTGLMLGACEQAPEPVAVPPRAGHETPGDEAPLERGLDPAQIAHGRVVFDRHCAQCHGAAGRGQPGDWRVRDADGRYPPPPLDDSAHAWHHPTAALLEAVRKGSPPGEGNMPAWQRRLTEQEIQDVVVYIKSLWSDRVYRLWLNMEQQSLGG
jgi:mono/diheme cytochrome c family protein